MNLLLQSPVEISPVADSGEGVDFGSVLRHSALYFRFVQGARQGPDRAHKQQYIADHNAHDTQAELAKVESNEPGPDQDRNQHGGWYKAARYKSSGSPRMENANSIRGPLE